MAKSKIADYREMETLDLTGELEKTSQEYQRMKFEHAVKGLGNPLMLRVLRREIAQIYTELRTRELASLTTDEKANRSRILRRRRLNS